MNCYVYAYIRSKDSTTAKAGTPYYIGQGRGKRMYQKHTVPVPADRNFIVVVEKGLTELGAKAIERRLIRWHGLVSDGGILRNMTHGGDGATGVGGLLSPRYGIARPDLALRNKTMTGEAHPSKQHGYIHPMTGKKHNPDTIQKMVERWEGGKHPMLGRPVSSETRQKIADGNRGKSSTAWNKGIPATEDVKQKLKDLRRGKVWWTDGVVSTMAQESPGDGWRRGRILRGSSPPCT